MASTKKCKLDIKGETAKEPVKKQKPAVAKSEQRPSIPIYTTLVSVLDVVKEPFCKSSQSYLKQPAMASKSNSDYIFLFTTMCPSHTQTQRTTRMRMSDVQQDQTKVKGDLLSSSPMCQSLSRNSLGQRRNLSRISLRHKESIQWLLKRQSQGEVAHPTRYTNHFRCVSSINPCTAKSCPTNPHLNHTSTCSDPSSSSWD